MKMLYGFLILILVAGVYAYYTASDRNSIITDCFEPVLKDASELFEADQFADPGGNPTFVPLSIYPPMGVEVETYRKLNIEGLIATGMLSGNYPLVDPGQQVMLTGNVVHTKKGWLAFIFGKGGQYNSIILEMDDKQYISLKGILRPEIQAHINAGNCVVD